MQGDECKCDGCRNDPKPTGFFDPQSDHPDFATYVSHKIVRAAKITGIYSRSRRVATGPDSYVSFSDIGKPQPKIGWYVVCYGDGYVSFSPPEAFEKGYHRAESPDTSPDVTLAEAQAIVETKPAPRVTVDSINAKIRRADYYFHLHLTICVLTLENGFFVVGKAAPADVANFDGAVGERYAYEDAFRQIWQLEGYALRDRLASAS